MSPRIYAELVRIHSRPLGIDEGVWVRKVAVDGIEMCAPLVRARPLRIHLRIYVRPLSKMLGPSKYTSEYMQGPSEYTSTDVLRLSEYISKCMLGLSECTSEYMLGPSEYVS